MKLEARQMNEIDKAKINAQKVTIRLPSWARMLKVFRDIKVMSVLRSLEYERLAKLELEGYVLDFGGGEKSLYNEQIETWMKDKTNYRYESANIDQTLSPTYLIEEGGKIPVADKKYDVVISLNTFEHVRDLRTALNEICRTLRPGGRLIFVVPFMFRVHGHPDDYIRGTPSFWKMILDQNGFDSTTFEALSWGPFSTGSMISGPYGPLPRLRMMCALFLDLLILRWRHPKTEFMNVEQDDPIANSAMGYLVEARAV